MHQDQGHWILAKMGKSVLRPGGKALTLKMLQGLNIQKTDDVVEFAPGIGFTANLIFGKEPKTYVGVELNEEAAANLRKKITGPNREIVVANAAETGLADNSKDKVIGEAMLTMQADHRKSTIIKEAFRILKPGGYYSIHELGLMPDDMPEDEKEEIQKSMAKVIKVNARPLTEKEWKALLVEEGFEIVSVETNPMDLLKPRRIIDDEGLLRFLKICLNILSHPTERARILEMRQIFKKNEKNLNGIMIIARKKS